MAHHIRYTVTGNDGARIIAKETHKTCELVSAISKSAQPVPELPEEPVIQHSYDTYYSSDRLVLHKHIKQWSLKPNQNGCSIEWKARTDIDIHTAAGVCSIKPSLKTASGECQSTLGTVTDTQAAKAIYKVPAVGTESILGHTCTIYKPTAEGLALAQNHFSGSVCVFTPKSNWTAFLPRTWQGYQKGIVLKFETNTSAELIGRTTATASEVNLDIVVTEEVLNPLKSGTYKILDRK